MLLLKCYFHASTLTICPWFGDLYTTPSSIFYALDGMGCE
uniref:Uncharacterized protein n=1 Tax=Arundo donax TaxID=35708 RepID=A0A0A9BCM2_ARUDO